MASSKIRNSSSFLTFILSFLNFILFILSAASLAPIICLKMPPTSLGIAFLMVSSISLLSAFVGFYSQLTHLCYITHVSLLISSLTGQVLGFLALFTKEKSSLLMLKSPRDPREAKVLVRLECGALMAMILMQFGVLVLSCVVHSCWVRENEDLEAEREREATEMKRREKIAKIEEESQANVMKIQEMKGLELELKMKNKYGHLNSSDYQV